MRQQWGSFRSALTHWGLCLYHINMKTLLSYHYWYQIILIYQGYHRTDIISHYTDIIPYDYTILIAHHTDIAAYWYAILISCDCPAYRTSLIATRFWVVMICPIIKCLTVLEFSFILFDLCLFITIFNFILNYVPIVTFLILTYHKI